MNKSIVHPRRRFRDEFLALSLVLSCPAIMSVAILHGLWNFSGRDCCRNASVNAFCSFVKLSPDAERRAVSSARTAWHVGTRIDSCERPNLFAEIVPYRAPDGVVRASDRARRRKSPVFHADFRGLMPPSLAASPPSALSAPVPDSPARPAFSRSELLQLQVKTDNH